jgi:hypothetical protein
MIQHLDTKSNFITTINTNVKWYLIRFFSLRLRTLAKLYIPARRDYGNFTLI